MRPLDITATVNTSLTPTLNHAASLRLETAARPIAPSTEAPQ